MRGVTVFNSGSYSKCIYVHLNFIKYLKCHISYADYLLLFYTCLFFFSPGVASESHWPVLGLGSKRLANTVLLHTPRGRRHTQ